MRLFLGIILISSCVACSWAQSSDAHPAPPATPDAVKPTGDSQNQQPGTPDQSTPAPPSASGAGSPGTPDSTQSSADKANQPQSPTPPPDATQNTSTAPASQTFPPATPPSPSTAAAQPPAAPAQPEIPEGKRQPKRILGVMPNYRAVSAGEVPPPPTARQAFMVATQNSFDYSSFIFVGITSAMAEGTDAHPQLGKGVAGFGRYYWRGLLDKTDGNYLVIFALPTLLHEDERYYAMGEGGFWRRATYSATRVFITPDYHGHNTFNFSEVLGRGMAQGVSLSYYPSHDRTLGALASKYGYALGRDALTNVFREFWPDIATHVLHRHP